MEREQAAMCILRRVEKVKERGGEGDQRQLMATCPWRGWATTEKEEEIKRGRGAVPQMRTVQTPEEGLGHET
ncbi:hypothetical protein COCNU_07G011010 [Cocos nucifera]|uniref:Uncharacterized protein n=1 Tax=Cocos nucifera TaxID=13894 RepID=A0A8K0IGE4_COCNU|nr:hypothetical protein COCNU_07G011010 [Cocos nucifera]